MKDRKPLARLTESEVESHIVALAGWSLDQGKLFKEFKFKDFAEAFAFMTEVAKEADASDHHPEWSNIYDTVRVHLSTHEVGGLSHRDFELAAQMNSLASR